MRNFFYGTEFKRILMRFAEIFVLAGIMGLANSVEFERVIIASFGTGLSAAILKFLRDITKK